MEETDVVIKLRFEPRGRGHEGNLYYLAPKANECVVCAAQVGLLRYHFTCVSGTKVQILTQKALVGIRLCHTRIAGISRNF